MNKLNLDHHLTPPSLKELNKQINELFSKDSIDESELLKIIQRREILIQEYWQFLGDESQKAFANAELEVNGLLVAYVKELSNLTLKNLSEVIRGRKAVKKYI